MQYRLGYIGFGSMAGDYHYKTAMRDDIPFTPVAVYDIRPEIRKNAEEKGLKAFDNLQDFLDSHLFDMVIVATCNQYHCELTCAALEAGYHVMCEKPVAMTVEEVEKMIATAKRVNKMFTVHHNRRWDQDCLVMKQALAADKIGKLFAIENRIHHPSKGVMFGWRLFDDHGGGYFCDWGIHMLDQLLYLITEPVHSVWGTIRKVRSPEGDDYSKIIITFKSGLVAQVEASNFAALPMSKWYAYGEKGAISIPEICKAEGKMKYIEDPIPVEATTIVYPDRTPSERTYTDYQVSEWQEVDLPLEPVSQDWALLYKNVGAALDGTEELVVTPESILRCFKVLDAARRSNETGLTIVLD